MKKEILEYLKVPEGTVKDYIEKLQEDEIKRFESMLSRELKSEKDAYDNIVEMEEFLSKPHDYILDARNKVNEKLYAIQNIMGKDVLEKGMEIYETDNALKEMNSTMSIEERLKIEQEIMNNPKLAEQLNSLRYDPKTSKIQKGEVVKYQAVYAKMMEEVRMKEYEELNKSSETNQLDEK